MIFGLWNSRKLRERRKSLNAAVISVDAKVVGSGRVVLAGSGKVDFADISVFDGTLDVAGNGEAAVGALYGIVAVTNSADSAGALSVDGSSPFGYFGEISGIGSLLVSGRLVLSPVAEFAPDTDLTLAGGTLDLLGPLAFASLSGHGAVSGAAMSVAGETTPEKSDSEYALTFSTYPSLSSIADGWSLRRIGDGAAIRARPGLIFLLK